MQEREISFINLITGFMLHWRSIIVLVLLGMLLMGTFSYVQSIGENATQKERVQEAKEQIELLTEKEQNGEILSEDEKGELELLEAVVQKGITINVGVDMTHVFLGAVLTVGIYAFVYFLIVIFDPHIMITDELEELFSIAQLGLIVEDRKSSKFLGRIDDAIIYLRNHKKRRPTGVTALKLAYVAVGVSAERNDLNEIYFVGCDIKGHSAYVCDQLKAALERKHFRVEILNNVLYDPEAMSKLEQVESVVLVERAGKTMYKEIQRELELMDKLNIKVLGGILVQ